MGWQFSVGHVGVGDAAGPAAGTVGGVPRYTPPSDNEPESPLRRRPLSVRIGVWVLLVGVIALVFADVVAAFI